MFPIGYVVLAVAILLVLYLLYNFNKKYDVSSESNSMNNQYKNNNIDNNIDNNIHNSPDKKEERVKLGVYYTDWCGYSKQFLNELENGLGDDIHQNGADIVLVDCEKNKDVCNAMGVEGFPTLILHTSNGNINYDGERNSSSIIEFIRNNKN